MRTSQKASFRKEKAKVIAEACDEILAGKWNGEFPLVVYQTGSGTQSNMNMNEVVAHIANAKLEAVGSETRIHPNDDVNMSQSSNDTFPTAMHVAAVSVLHRCLYQPLAELIATFHKKSEEYMHVVKIGRTHVQDAVPLTFGQEVSGWTTMLEKCQHMIEASEKYLLGLAIGGTAVGTGSMHRKTSAPEYRLRSPKKQAFLSYRKKIKFYALTGRDDFVFAHGALEALAMDCMKIADDLRLLQAGQEPASVSSPSGERTGFFHHAGQSEPDPVRSPDHGRLPCSWKSGRRLHGLLAGRFELNVYAPVLAQAFIESVKLLGEAIHSFNIHCAVGIEVNHDRMEELVEKSLMLVTALAPHIGYEKSAKISKKAFADGSSLKEAALALGYVTEEEYDRWVVAKDMCHVDW